jgi:hypothetical protein
MMRRLFYTALSVALAAGMLTSVRAQTTTQSPTFEETLQRLSLDAAKAYVNPIVSGFGVDLNGGWFHRAPRATMLGFDLELGAVVMGTFFKDDAKSFNSSGTFNFTQQQALNLTNFVLTDAAIPPAQRTAVQNSLVSQIVAQNFTLSVAGPTVVGPKTDSIRIRFASKTFTTPVGNVIVPGQDVTLPVSGYLENLKVLPLPSPQLTIGTFFGSQFTFRYLPSYNLKDLGKATYFGWGIQHNPAVWFGDVDALPIDLSLGFFTQKLKVGDVLDTKATTFGVNVSKRLGWGFLNLTPYAGYMFESSTMSFAYDFMAPDPTNGYKPTKVEHVTFDLESANKSRAVVGLSFKFLIVNINADYNFGKYNSATAGVMIII